MPAFGFSASSSPSSSPIQNTFSSLSRPETKRKQVKNACTNCQKACKKCDDQRPCSRCVKYGIEDSCVNSQRKDRKRKEDPLLSASESHSDRSSPLPAMSRSGREIRPVRNNLKEATRVSNRNIRTFSPELLQSLQDEEEFDDENDGFYAAKQDSSYTLQSPEISEEFKALAQICSDLHIKSHHLAQYTALSQFAYGAVLPVATVYPQQTYPMPPASFVNRFEVPSSPTPAAFYHHHQQQQLPYRTFLNRTPPEDLPSPVKSDDGNVTKFAPDSTL